MRNPIPRAARDRIVLFNVQTFCYLYTMALVLCLLHIEFASCRREYGRNVLVPDLQRASLSAKRIDEDLDALLSLGSPVCSRKQLLYPSIRARAICLVELVADHCGADNLFRDGMRILNGDGSISRLLGPEHIVERD
jgi:hypothetical protein